jgi:hypothetical protein
MTPAGGFPAAHERNCVLMLNNKVYFLEHFQSEFELNLKRKPLFINLLGCIVQGRNTVKETFL